MSHQPEIDLEEEMARLGLDIVAGTLFGEDLSGEEAAEISRVMRRILSLTDARADKQFDLPREEPQHGDQEFEALVAEFDDIIWKMIRRCRASGQETGDFLSLLISARDEETGETMSDRQVRDEVATIFLAGHETTASALSWTFFLLSSLPEPDRQVRKQVQQVLGSRPPGVQDLPRLQYTSRGRNFALMEVQLVVASVVQRFRMAPVPDYTIRPKARFILQSESGIPVTLVKAR